MRKEILSFLLVLYNLFGFSQNVIVSSDSIYLNVNESNIENFQDVYIKEFVFPSPTIRLSILNPNTFSSTSIFQPISDKLPDGSDFLYTDHKINGGKVKKITRKKDSFVEYSCYYNERKQLTKQSLNYYPWEELFNYDSLNRPSDWIRYNNRSHYKMEYNENNQLIKFSHISENTPFTTTIEYDKQNRPTTIFNTNKEDEKKYRYRLFYDNNIVNVETYNNRNDTLRVEYVFSENYNLIKETRNEYIFYHSYEKNNLLIKTVVFKNKELSSILKYKYNEQGNLINYLSYHTNGGNENNEERYFSNTPMRYEYDLFENIIFISSGDYNSYKYSSYGYEIEYY